MNFSSLPKPIDDGLSDHLLNMKLPEISLPNQDGRILSLNRRDTFRLVLYFYPMTGNPNKPLPKNWDNIPGARGCTPETCSFRDNYDELIKLNSIPVGITSQKIDHNPKLTEKENFETPGIMKKSIGFSNNFNEQNRLKLMTYQLK